MTRKSFFVLFLLLASLASKSQEPDPSWELSLNEATPYWDYMPTNLLELDDGNYLVPLVSTQEYQKSDERACEAKIIKVSADGEIMDEIIMRYDKGYIVNDISVDIWNDTINVFSHLVANDHRSAKIIHNYLFNNLSISEKREIYKVEFDTTLAAPLHARKGNVPLIDKEGNSTVMFGYSSEKFNKNNSENDGEYYVIAKAMFLKFDSKLNVIAEKWYDIEELHFYFSEPYTLNYNIDSTAYYFMSTAHNKPFKSQYVLDLDLNYLNRNTYTCSPQGVFDAVITNWTQSPYDGEMYGFGEVLTPWQDSELFMFKLNRYNNIAEYDICSNTENGINNGVLPGNNMCFSPNGNIYGLGIYSYVWYPYFAYNSNVCYIGVYDKDMIYQSEWYYQKSPEYNHFFENMYYTKTDDIIIMGELRHKKGSTVYYEPYMVKFPASAFDTENIEEAHANGLHLAVAYPNPGGDVLNIRTGLRNAVLSVYDINGRKIHEQEITNDVTSIDASGWNSGTYIWELGVRSVELGVKEVESGKWVK